MKNKLLQKNSRFVIEAAQRSKYDKVRKAASTYPSALNGLAAEARKCSTFEEFRKDFSIEIKHGTYWHLTTDPNFTIDSTKGPRDMSSMGGGGMSTGKLMITSHLENWDGYYNWEDDETEKVSRPYAALIDMSAVPRNSYRQVSRGFGNEFWVSDPSQAKVVSVMPIAKARAFNERQRQILGKYINSNKNLEKFYNWAKGETGNEAEEQGKTAKADDASMTLIQSLVTEMMSTLAAGLPRPEIKIINRVGNYLGQCRWKYGTGPSKGDWCDENTVIELQKRILGDERTLRRVLFHEGCHHEDFLLNSTKQFKEDGFRTYQMRQKIRRDDGHGAGFMAVAARFNAKYGKDFVTKTSDADMVIENNTKEFFILIKMDGGKLFYSVSYRISPEQRGFIDHVKARNPAKLCKSNLDMFSTGGKIGSSWSYPRDAEKEQRLQEIWQSSPPVDLPEAKSPDPNREFYVALRLAAVHNTHHMGYFAYSIDLSPKQKQQLQTIRDPWKVVKTNDKSFQTKKIGQGWDSAFLRWGDMMDRWQKLWDTAPVVMSGNLGKTATTDIPPENIQVITKSAFFDDRERDLKFNELANAQRGEPEEAMLKCQMHPLGAGIGTNALEHIGDLTHRMAENFSRFQGQYGIVKDKVEKVLRWLTNSYGFYREVQGNIKNNYEFQKDGKLKGVSFEDAKVDFFKRWDAYAAAHGKLTVYNDAQRWARDAAIALGRRDFSKAALYLGFLKDVLDKGNEAYIQAAGEYIPGKTAAITPADRTFYHGTNTEKEFETLKPTGGDPIVWLGELDTARDVYARFIYNNGRSRVYEVKLKPTAKIVDLTDANDPITKEYRKQHIAIGGGRTINDDWLSSFSCLHVSDRLLPWFRGLGVDGLIVNDRGRDMVNSKTKFHHSLALLNTNAIESQTEMNTEILKEAGIKSILQGLGVALLTGALGTAIATVPSNPQDKALNRVGHEMLKRLPQSIQSKIGDPNTITFKEGTVSGRDAICQVEKGTRVIYVNPRYVKDFLSTDIADQLTAHETTHIMQSEIDPKGDRFPKTNEADPYGKMRGADSWQVLRDLRAKGDKMWNHSREEQAAIVQQYEALTDQLKVATPAQKAEIERKMGVFESYVNDYDQMKGASSNDKTASNHKLYDHGNLPSFYDLFESGNHGCSYGIYDLLGGDEDWEPYVQKAMLLAAKKKVNLGEMEDEDRDQWVYDNVARADLEAKFNVVRERFAKMQFPLTVYRAIDLKKLSDFRTNIAPGKKPKNKLVPWSHEAFGHSWAWDEKGANNYGSDWQGSNDHTYIFRGLIASPKDVDWETTLQVNFLLPEEHEIRVLDGSSIQITGYKKHGGQWLEPEEQFKTVIASKLAIQGSTSITATQQPPEGLKLVSYWDWSESGDPNLAENAFIVYAKLNGVMVGDVEFITTKNGQLLPNKVYVEPEFRRKGIASAMYVLAEKETGMKIRRHPLQKPDGAALWDKNPDRKFGDDLLGEEKEKTATTASKKFNQKLPSRGEAISLMKELSQLGDMPFNFIAYESINPFPISLYYTDEQIQSLVDTYGELKEVDPTTLVSCQMQLDPDVLLYFLEEPSRINTAKNKVWWDEYPVVFHYKGALILYEGNHRANAALILGIPLKVKWVEADNIPFKDKTASDKTPPFSDTRYPNMDANNDEGSNAYALMPERIEGTQSFPTLESLMPKQGAEKSNEEPPYWDGEGRNGEPPYWDGEGRNGEFPGYEPGGKLSKIVEVPIAALNPTESFDESTVVELMNALLYGEEDIPAIIVERDFEEGTYFIVDGHNRFEAAKRAGYKGVPVRIWTSPDDLTVKNPTLKKQGAVLSKVFYHCSNAANADSIEEKGLLVNQAAEHSASDGGIYLLSSLDNAIAWAEEEMLPFYSPVDIWAVSIPKDVIVLPDTHADLGGWGSYVVYNNIPPENIEHETRLRADEGVSKQGDLAGDGAISFFEPVENEHSVQPLRAGEIKSAVLYEGEVEVTPEDVVEEGKMASGVPTWVPSFETMLQFEGEIDESDRKSYEFHAHNISELKFPLTIYRHIFVDSLDSIKFNSLGRFWADEEQLAFSHNGPDSENGTEGNIEVLLRAVVNPQDVDWEDTMYARIIFGQDEAEISIAPGTPLNITGMKVDKGEWQTPPAGAGKITAATKPKNQTETPAFKSWFEGSKVVDGRGRPLKVYHGTRFDFTWFDPRQSGKNTNHPTSHLGFYFTTNPDVTQLFQKIGPDKFYLPGAHVKVCYLNIKNPLVITAEEFREFCPSVAEREDPELQHMLKVRDKKLYDFGFKLKGHDGIHITADPRLKKNPWTEWRADCWVAFNSNQIKLAVGNNGEFDSNNVNITAGDETEGTASKTASPDFGYSQYNDKEIDLKKLRIKEPDHGIHLLEAEAIDPTKKAMESLQGYVTAAKMFLKREEVSYAITHSFINPEWRGTGLGQVLYDRIIAQAKKRNADYLYSDVKPNNLSNDAMNAWKRLEQRHPVEYDAGTSRFRISLKSADKTAGAGDFNAFVPRHHTEAPVLHSDPVDFAATDQEAWDAAFPDHKVAFVNNDRKLIVKRASFDEKAPPIISLRVRSKYKAPDSALDYDGNQFESLIILLGSKPVGEVEVQLGKDVATLRNMLVYADDDQRKGIGRQVVSLLIAKYAPRELRSSFDKNIHKGQESVGMSEGAQAMMEKLVAAGTARKVQTDDGRFYYEMIPSEMKTAAVTQDQDWMGKPNDITDTPAFKAWFKGSKVVDDHGRPLRVYHGTSKYFDEFNSQTKNRAPLSNLGFYFTSDPELASMFTKKKWTGGGKFPRGANVKPCYLSIKNPKRLGAYDWMQYSNSSPEMVRGLREQWLSEGYDGLIVEPLKNDPTGELHVAQIIAFHPNQIKSAIGNKGNFDPKDNRITASKKTAASQEQMLAEGKAFETACFPPGEPGYAPADSLNWVDEVNFDLHKLDGFDEGHYDFLAHDFLQDMWDRGYEDAEAYTKELQEAIRNNTVDPILVAQGNDGKFYVWDGNHRVGLAHVDGITLMHAWVGYQKPTKEAATKYREETGWRPAAEVRVGDWLVMPGTLMEVERIISQGDELVMEGKRKGQFRRFDPKDVVNVHRKVKVASSILKSYEYPPVLNDAYAIAEYIESVSSEYVDVEFMEDYFRGTHATLREVPIDSLIEGNPDGNIPNISKERKYRKLDFSTMPPIVIQDNKIVDGNHRYRVAQAVGRPTIWAYVVAEGKGKVAIVSIDWNDNKSGLYNGINFMWKRKLRINKPSFLGNMGSYEIYAMDVRDNPIYMVFDPKNQINAGYATFLSHPNGLEVETLAFALEYQGLGLGVELYKWLIMKQDITLMSGYEQTKGGRATWEKLAQTPGILVYGWDKKSQEAFSLDPTDLSAEEPIWSSDVVDDETGEPVKVNVPKFQNIVLVAIKK